MTSMVTLIKFYFVSLIDFLVNNELIYIFQQTENGSSVSILGLKDDGLGGHILVEPDRPSSSEKHYE